MKIAGVSFLTIVLMSLLMVNCAPGEGDSSEDITSVGRDGWLSGTTDEKFETVTNHFGGFARAMMEVNYRYVELFWAGEDENWDYAAYQLEEMEEALEDGFQRRPGRKASGEHFMEVVMPEMVSAIQSEDKRVFDEAFELFTLQCNSCHAMEDAAYIHVNKPEKRHTNIGLRR